MAKIETSWDLANNYVANWAIEHATELVPKVDPAIASELAKLTSEWVLSDQDMRGFTRKIMEHTFPNNIRFDKERAKKVAVYLSTKVYAYGNAAELEEHGYGKALVLPPQCDGCRCNIRQWSPKGDHTQKAIRWLTCIDEHVCTTPIKTPWGVVNGCKALHNVIISEGPFLGKHIDEIKITIDMGKCPHCGKETPIKRYRCEHCKQVIDDSLQKTIDEYIEKSLTKKVKPKSNNLNWIIAITIVVIVLSVFIFAK